MKKTYFGFSAMLMFVLIVSSGCTKPSDMTATISANSDSEYMNTFEELGLGILYDFDFRLPDADNRWVTMWVESYKNGEKEPQPITELSYGLSPKQVEEGNIGFGIINPNTDAPLLFLYAPGTTIAPQKIQQNNSSFKVSTWDYAIGDEKVELKLGETNLLGVYRQSSKNSIRAYDLQDENAVKQMINEDSRVLLLKIKIDEAMDDN